MPTTRKWIKWLLTLAGTGTVVVLGLIGPWPIDQSDPIETNAGREALTAASALGRELERRQEPQPFRAGWTSIPFDLPEGTPLAGYGDREGAPSEGTLEPLGVRAFLIETDSRRVVILCSDLLIVPPKVANQVLREVDDEMVVLFTATHTHGGPGAWDDSFLGEIMAGAYDPDVVRALSNTFVAALRQSVRKVKPAEWGWIETTEPELVRNRTVKDGVTDPTLEALVLRQGDQHGLIGFYGAHATCLTETEMRFHGDYPGAFIREVESDDRIDFAAFATGVAGSQSPQGQGASEREKADFMAEQLAEGLLSEWEGIEWRNTMDLKAETMAFTAPSLQLRIGNNLRFSSLVMGTLHQGDSAITALRMDEHLWVGIPFELSCMISVPLRELAARENRRLHLTCFSGDYLGYVIPDHLWADGELYEARMNFMGPWGGSFVEAMLKAIITGEKLKEGGHSRPPGG